MALNYIWIALFIIGFLVGVIKLLMGDYETLPAMMDSTFEMSKDGFEMCLGLTYCGWVSSKSVKTVD